MISHWARTWITRIYKPILQFLHQAGVTANMLTVAGLIAAGVTGLLVGYRQFLWAALALVISGLFDSFDGELARLSQQSTPVGAFIDSICDHYGDFAVYLGLLAFFLNQDAEPGIFLVFFAMFGSLIGSQVRSRAGMLGIDTRTVGFFTRMERTLVLLMGLITGQVLIAVAILALANNLSALQRVAYALRVAQN